MSVGNFLFSFLLPQKLNRRTNVVLAYNYPLTAKNYRLYNKMEITFSKQELIDLFKLAKEENIPTHLNNTIKNIKSNGLQNLVNYPFAKDKWASGFTDLCFVTKVLLESPPV